MGGCRQASFQNHTYVLCAYAGLDWYAARAYCQGLGADLISIGTEAENTWAFTEDAEGGSIWIGANDQEAEGFFRWPDGTYVKEGYMNWAATQPNDAEAGEDCAVLHSGAGTWNDVACTEVEFGTGPISLICERAN